MAQSFLDGDLIVNGIIAPRTISLPAGTVTAASVAALANVEATKLEQQFQANFSQEGGTNASAEVRIVHVVRGATGSVIGFVAGSVVAGTSTGVRTVDLKKNGTTVLSAPITLDSGNTAYVVESATISVPALAAGNVLTVVVAGVVGSTLPQGVFARATIRETANP